MTIIKMVIYMIVRLGYVSLSKTLENITPSKTITYTNYLKQPDIKKIENLIKQNLNNLSKIIDYNIKNDIHFYRITSNLIPLGTHKDVQFDYINKFQKEYNQISSKIKKHHMRVDFHPDQYTVLNSTKKEVIENTFQILKHHYNLSKALKINPPVIIVHVGSNTFGKKNSLTRFINNFNKLPNNIKKAIVVENDDKIFNIEDVLDLTTKLKIPFVLDYHHHICNNDGLNIDDYLEKIFNTWTLIRPKIHFSSPKSKLKKEFRTHHEYINVDEFITLIEKIKKYNIDVDIMLEAKGKDEALFRLVRQLKYKTNYHFIDETSFEV